MLLKQYISIRRSDMSPHTPPIATRDSKVFDLDEDSSLDMVYAHSRSISAHRSPPGSNYCQLHFYLFTKVQYNQDLFLYFRLP